MLQKDEKLKELVIASVLHDIGKMFQRCRNKRYEKGDEIEESLYCPYIKGKNYFGYRHVLYTYGFLDEHRDDLPPGVNPENIVECAAKHHKPDTPLQKIVQQADWISAGHDRLFEEDENVPEATKYFEQPLKSIFSSISLPFCQTLSGKRDGGREVPPASYYRLSELHGKKASFPLREFKRLDSSDYKSLSEQFERDFEALNGLPFEQYQHSVDSLLREYTWAIPASTNSKPDVSLYDHLSTTAGFASVLYLYHKEHETLDNEREIENKHKKKFLLISGDLSGIQRYIFNLPTTTFNAKVLRARSFELQLIGKATVKHILNRLDLPLFAELMDAGGRFLLVAPNTEKTQETVRLLRKEIESTFLKRYMGELTLNLSEPIAVSAEDLDQDKAWQVFREITLAAADAKTRKLQAALSEHGHILDHNYERLRGNENLCPLCEVRPAETTIDHHEQRYTLCSICSEQVLLGQYIPKTKYLVFSGKGNSRGEKGKGLPFAYTLPFGENVVLVGESESDFLKKRINEGDLVYILNENEAGYASMDLPFFLPKDEETQEILTFEDLAMQSEGEGKIAMMKSDVDNLGLIFSIGLGESLSISRFTTLSRMMNHFFSSYIHEKISEKWNHIYPVFSGGDDLCVLGPWNEILSFAGDVWGEFASFTGENPNVTISTGITLAAHNLPVRNIALEAERQLKEKAKGSIGKNHLSLFDIPVKRGEYKELISFGERLYSFLEDEKLTKGLVYRLLQYGRSERKMKHGYVSKDDALWRSHFSYDLARNGGQLNEEEKSELVSKIERHISSLEIPVQYALYRSRGNSVRTQIKGEVMYGN